MTPMDRAMADILLHRAGIACFIGEHPARADLASIVS
jgi:hypothetical protein